MSDKKKDDSERKLTAYERWELPHLESNQEKKAFSPGILVQKEETVTMEEVDQDSLVYEPLTASQLEEIRSAAYEEGFIQGEAEGHAKGYEDGRAQGEINGFESGFEKGAEKGKEEGHSEAIDLAKTQLEALENVLANVVQEIVHPLEESRAGVEVLLYKTMVRMVENICLSQMKEEGHRVLKDQLARIFDEMGEFEGRIRLKLHPDTVDVLESLDVDDRLVLQVEPDASLIEGGFVLDCKSFHVDGRVEQRLESVCNELHNLSDSEQ
ncbi:flagellar assembly protein H [Marinomonas spartinae]|uniref:Flagellar assembly protein FliH n=1 Tax=Marinomonas spartinae TaxID=1792290 RepID=A0A1A8TIW1_9GAMM|nr:FliH/SctL family protein [Marinomonas spartinae]SBS32722.1 flagellar assembly protein H [Marinomonas spartinae]